MLRAITMIGVVCFTLSPTSHAQLPSTEPKAPLPEFTRSVALGDRRFEYAELKDVLAILRKKYKCDAVLDEAAFEKRGIKSVAEMTIDLPKLGTAPAGLILEMIARQVGGTIRSDGGQIKLVPGAARDLKWLVAAPTPKLATELLKPVTLEKPIEGAPLKDILEFLSDKYGLDIVVDDWAFRKQGAKSAGDSQCALPVGTMPMGKWLDHLAKLVDGALMLSGDGLVVIVPANKEK
jgi:hypothetical protein